MISTVQLLKAKLHLFPVTETLLNYEGSCGIDPDYMDEVGLHEFEQIHIFNQNNGERFITYAISADVGSKAITLNGAAARKAQVGDKLIIVAFHLVNEADLICDRNRFAPRVLTYEEALKKF